MGCGDAGDELRGRRRREPRGRRAERRPARSVAAPGSRLRLLRLRLVGRGAARRLLRAHLGSRAAPRGRRPPAAERAVPSMRCPPGRAACPGARRCLRLLPPGSRRRAATPTRAAAQPPPPPPQRPQPPPEPPDARRDTGGRGGARTRVTTPSTLSRTAGPREPAPHRGCPCPSGPGFRLHWNSGVPGAVILKNGGAGELARGGRHLADHLLTRLHRI